MKKINFLLVAFFSVVCFLGLTSCEKETGNNLSSENSDENNSEAEPYISWSDLEGIWVSNESFMTEVSRIAADSYYTQAKLTSLIYITTHYGFRITDDGYYQPVTVKLTSGLGTIDNRAAEIATPDGYATWQATNDGSSTFLGSISDHLEVGNSDFDIVSYYEEYSVTFTSGFRASLNLSSDITCKYSVLQIYDNGVYVRIKSIL